MEKLTVRPFTMDGVDDLLRIARHPEVTKYTPNLIRDRDLMMAWAENLLETCHEYMILLDGNVIGECSLDEKDGDIGVMLFPEYWRQGYGTAVIKQLMQTAVKLGLEGAQAKTDENNAACIGLLRKLDFQKVGAGWNLSEDDWEKSLAEIQTLLIFQKELADKI